MMNTDPAVLRIVYASRALGATDAPAQAAGLAAILATARAHNAANGITGLLIVANGHFLQVLEGDAAAVDTLYRRIAADPRHRDLVLLSRVESNTRGFGTWSMGLVERSEPEEATAARLRWLVDILSHDTEVSAGDFCRLLLAPSVNPGSISQRRLRPRTDPIPSVAFASPAGLWSAAVLQHMASTEMRRTGRTAVIDPDDAARRTLIEYIDVELPGVGPMRALSLAAGSESFAPVAPLMERLTLLVFLMAASDAEGFVAYVGAWLAMPQVVAAAPRILILSGMPSARVQPMRDALQSGTTLPLEFASMRLSDSEAVWHAAERALRDENAAQRSSARLSAQGAGDSARLEPDAGDANASEATRAVSNCLSELLGIDGAKAAALIDAVSGKVLLTRCTPDASAHSFDADAAVLLAKRRLVQSLGLDEPIEDITITTRNTLALFRSLHEHPDLFITVALDREHVQLATARLCLQQIVETLALQSVSLRPLEFARCPP